MEDLIKSIIKKDGLAKKCRTVDVVNKRIYLFNFLRNNGYTFNVIGNLFNLDHTTVIHGIKRYKELSATNDAMLQVDTERYVGLLKDVKAAVINYNLEKDVRKATTVRDLDIIKRRLTNNLYE